MHQQLATASSTFRGGFHAPLAYDAPPLEAKADEAPWSTEGGLMQSDFLNPSSGRVGRIAWPPTRRLRIPSGPNGLRHGALLNRVPWGRPRTLSAAGRRMTAAFILGSLIFVGSELIFAQATYCPESISVNQKTERVPGGLDRGAECL